MLTIPSSWNTKWPTPFASGWWTTMFVSHSESYLRPKHHFVLVFLPSVADVGRSQTDGVNGEIERNQESQWSNAVKYVTWYYNTAWSDCKMGPNTTLLTWISDKESKLTFSPEAHGWPHRCRPNKASLCAMKSLLIVEPITPCGVCRGAMWLTHHPIWPYNQFALQKLCN